jgi:hypothetical protein
MCAKNIKDKEIVNLELKGFMRYLYSMSLVFLWRERVE